MRVLHVIDPRSPDGGPCTLRLLAEVARRLDAQHDVLVIGGREDVDLAVRCGVDVAGSICPSRALPWAGARALRQAGVAVARTRSRADLVHAWTARSGALATAAFPARPGITTLHVGPGDSPQWWYTVRTLNHGTHALLAASTAIRRQWRNRGLAADRVALLPPGVDGSSAAGARQSLRALLAERCEVDIGASTFVVGLLSEPAECADASVAATIAARVALSGRRIMLLVHPGAAHRMLAESMMHRLGFSDAIVADELIGQPWIIAPALDAALCIENRAVRASATSVLPLLTALACAVPVVAEESDSLRDVLEDGAGCLVVKVGEINAAAECLRRLHDAEALRRRLAEQGKSLAGDMFDADAYAARLRHSYDLLLANRTVRTTADPSLTADMIAETAVA